ncbi:MAG: phosphoribosyl-ATP diphosphatase [Gemmatimonadetes bacterium]|nr:phosphoribosyl-ATP diphosphatase [Gemmatimonadota bacterium]
MIIPSIDLMDGRAVQLRQGKERVLDAGDPRPLARRFGRVGEVAVVDLDAALGTGSNAPLIEDLCKIAPCRVGGGIRSVESAIAWLDRGAEKVVLGTAAVPDVLKELPTQRVVAALDAWEGEVVVKGWTEGTGRSIEDTMKDLAGLAGGFLVTFVEGEGMEGGFPREAVSRLVDAAPAPLTIAGGIATPEEIGWLDRQGADAQVGMALYKGTLALGEAFCAPMTSERADGLFPTVVADESDRVLGLVWSSVESVEAALEEGRGIYQSRSRGLWRKGESSGAVQELLDVSLDCDRDALLFRVRQSDPGFCHTGTRSCFGPSTGLAALEQTIRLRRTSAGPGSLTRRLLDDPALLRGKLIEEAAEAGDAKSREAAVEEAADVLYFLSVLLTGHDASISDAERALDRRARAVTRRAPSDPKGPGRSPGGAGSENRGEGP